MKKALLSIAVALCALSANAQGISAVGANVVILPSVKWDKTAYNAMTYVINSGTRFDTGGSNTSDKNEDGTYVNPNYNVVLGEPAEDSNGNKWYDPAYDTADESTIGEAPNGDEIMWEEHTAPFSTDETYNGLPSYQWTSGEIMADIYFRRTFTTTSILANDVFLCCAHDDAPCEFYLNGTLIWSETDGWDESKYYQLTEEQKTLIHKDGTENVIAVHVHQNWGGAYADCGLYTYVQGGLKMGYQEAWNGRTLFNSCGGYNYSGSSNFRSGGGLHNWEKLYEAQEGDVYTLHQTTESLDDWQSQLHFKTPINIAEDHEYTFKVTLTPTNDYDQVFVKLCDNDNDETAVVDDNISITGGEAYNYEGTFSGTTINNLKIVFDFAWGYKNSDVAISNMSVYDETAQKELWVGTSYFNYMYFCNDGTHVKDPALDGRQESKSWTMADYDDTAWDENVMPIGSADYDGGSYVSTVWPDGVSNNAMEQTGNGNAGNTGDNTGFWIRRNFTIDKINPKLSYALNVCHDDDYETYVNGHLLQQNTGWTNGKNPVQVHIPASYLIAGNNVIATEIHQNWGGRFYDCGINVEEVDYDACLKTLTDAIAEAEAWLATADLTTAMRAKAEEAIATAKEKAETEVDAAELKYYAENDFKSIIDEYKSASETVTIGRTMMAITKGQQGYNGEIALARPTDEEFEAFATVAEINNAVNKIKIVRKRTAAERRPNTFTGTTPQAGDFYLYNVGEQQFLGSADDWGTHMATEYASNAMTLIPSAEVDPENPVENGYVIQTHRPNGEEGTNDYANYGGYIDTANKDVWVFVPVEGKTNVYNVRRSGENGDNGVYMGYRGARNAEGEYDNQNGYSYNVIDSDMRSPELESNQWMLITKAELDGQVSLASETNGVDMTHVISNPGFDQRLTMASWENWENPGAVWGRGDNHSDFVHENWNCACALAQDIVDDAIIPGWYTLEVQGYYREGTKEHHAELLASGEKIESLATLFAGDEETTLRTIDDNNVIIPYTINSTHVYNGVRCPDYPTDAAEAFEHGAYKNVLKFEVTDGGEIYFGVETPYTEGEDAQYGRWTVVDNFRLKYWGANEPTDEQTAISEVAADKTSVQGIFNLQGQKLQKAVKGVNIINGRKVVIK